MDRARKLLEFSKAELNGIVLLVIIVSIMLFLPKLISAPEPHYDFNDFKKDIAEFKASEIKRSFPLSPKVTYANRAAVRYFLFDPNTIGSEKWEMLGIKPYTAKVIRNFVAKGGRFYKKEDLKRIYSLTPEIYDKLSPFIRIEPNPVRAAVPYEIKRLVKAPKVPVEINSADSSLLETITGIGPAFARRIIKYRERIGGFYRKEQLREVYGLDSAKFMQIEKQIIVDPMVIRKININTAVFEELKKLPYMSYKQLNSIIKYREQHGKYSEPGDLVRTGTIGEEIVSRIVPYLVF